MRDSYKAIIDAAERRMCIGGFNGFSFRDISADVGLKSASIHHHFPTKEKLAAAVVRSYTRRFSDDLETELAQQPDPIRAWVRVFRRTITSQNHICPCVVLGSGSQDLPEELAQEVRNFFRMQADKLRAAGLQGDLATKLLASIVGALLLAAVSDGVEAYDAATTGLLAQ